MIDKSEIDAKSDELGVHAANIQRDYVFGWLLSGLFQPENALRSHLILKGGNGFRKAYFEHARFSNDLDFSTQSELGEDVLGESIRQACRFAMEKSGVEFLPDQNRIAVKELAQVDSIVYEARVYFKSFYGDEEVTIKVKLDITEYDQIFLPIQTRRLIHAYSDAESCSAELKCIKLEELIASKLKALLQRRHSPDLYDLVYAVLFQKLLDVSRLEVISTFLKKTIYEGNPQLAKGLLLELPFQVFRGLWNEYLICPKPSLIAFDDAEAWFRTIVAELFALPQPQYAFAPGGGASIGLSYFGSQNRSTIVGAGSVQRLVRLVYDGVTRIVEPYSLAFKRRKDGVGQEYLYAWDRTGGRSGHIGIKSFINDKIQSLQMLDETFEPRFPIELAKGTGYFAKPFARPSGYRASPPKSSHSSSLTTTYTIECPYCSERFKRSKRDTRLNEHKDRFGNRCFGKTGVIVY